MYMYIHTFIYIYIYSYISTYVRIYVHIPVYTCRAPKDICDEGISPGSFPKYP